MCRCCTYYLIIYLCIYFSQNCDIKQCVSPVTETRSMLKAFSSADVWSRTEGNMKMMKGIVRINSIHLELIISILKLVEINSCMIIIIANN